MLLPAEGMGQSGIEIFQKFDMQEMVIIFGVFISHGLPPAFCSRPCDYSSVLPVLTGVHRGQAGVLS